MEIIGSQLDFALEFGFNAPVVSRRVSLASLEELMSSHKEKAILKETKGLQGS